VLVLPPIPEDPSNNLIDWFCESSKVFNSLREAMMSAYSKKIQRLHDMPRKAGSIFWWPFTQHSLVPEQTVTVIDSRYGENFAIYKVCTKTAEFLILNIYKKRNKFKWSVHCIEWFCNLIYLK